MILIDIKKGNAYSNLMRFSSLLSNKVYQYEDINKKSVKKILLVKQVNGNVEKECYFLDCKDEYVDIFTFFTPDLFSSHSDISIEINSSNEIVIKLLNNDIEEFYRIYLIDNLKYEELKHLTAIKNLELKNVYLVKKSRKKMLLEFNNIYEVINPDIVKQFTKDSLSLDYSTDDGINWTKVYSGIDFESLTFKNAMYRLSYI